MSAVWAVSAPTTRHIDYWDPGTGVRRSGKVRVTRAAHLVRDGRTVCARPADPDAIPVPEVSDPSIDYCWKCTEVGPDALTYRDMLVGSGMSYRQLDHACRKGWLRPDNPGSGSGSVRTFQVTELAVAAEMGRLTRAGVQAGVAATLARGPRSESLELAWASRRGECA